MIFKRKNLRKQGGKTVNGELLTNNGEFKYAE